MNNVPPLEPVILTNRPRTRPRNQSLLPYSCREVPYYHSGCFDIQRGGMIPRCEITTNVQDHFHQHGHLFRTFYVQLRTSNCGKLESLFSWFLQASRWHGEGCAER